MRLGDGKEAQEDAIRSPSVDDQLGRPVATATAAVMRSVQALVSWLGSERRSGACTLSVRNIASRG
jgi:hypothetical protein